MTVGANTKIEKSSEQMAARTKISFGQMAAAAGALTAGIVGFATSFDTLERANVNAQKATLTYNKALERLNEMQETGKASAEELANQQETVRLALEKQKLAQDNLGDTYANFFANIPAQLTSFAVTGQVLIKGITSANIAQALSWHAVGAAMKAAFITNPVGLVLIGITTLILLLVFNVGGLRDMFYEAGKAVMAFLDVHLKPLADFIRWFIDNVVKPLSNWFGTLLPADMGKANASFTSTEVILGERMPAAAKRAKDSVDEFTSSALKGLSSAEREAARLQSRLGAFGPAGGSGKASGFGASLLGTEPGSIAEAAALTEQFGSFTANKVLESRANKRFGGLFVAGKGRVLQGGGTLFEDVLGFGMRTGTPHLMHEGEKVSPAGGVTHIHFEVDGKEIASAIIDQYGNTQFKARRRHTTNLPRY